MDGEGLPSSDHSRRRSTNWTKASFSQAESLTKALFSIVEVGVRLRQGFGNEFSLIFCHFLCANIPFKQAKKLQNVFFFRFGAKILFWNRCWPEASVLPT